MKESYIHYGKDKIVSSLPAGWNVISDQDRSSVPGAADPPAEIRRALDSPTGSPPIEELARPGMEVILLFDDLQRPTPIHLAMPELMDRLNRAGVPDERVTAICAVGTHPALTPEQLERKVGKLASSRLEGRLLCHDPHAPSMSPRGFRRSK